MTTLRYNDMRAKNAERQRRYRQRALKDPDGLLLTRLQVLLSPHAAAALDRLAQERGCTKRQVIEDLLIQADPALRPDYP